jgi:hypothetical protein
VATLRLRKGEVKMAECKGCGGTGSCKQCNGSGSGPHGWETAKNVEVLVIVQLVGALEKLNKIYLGRLGNSAFVNSY